MRVQGGAFLPASRAFRRGRASPSLTWPPAGMRRRRQKAHAPQRTAVATALQVVASPRLPHPGALQPRQYSPQPVRINPNLLQQHCQAHLPPTRHRPPPPRTPPPRTPPTCRRSSSRAPTGTAASCGAQASSSRPASRRWVGGEGRGSQSRVGGSSAAKDIAPPTRTQAVDAPLASSCSASPAICEASSGAGRKRGVMAPPDAATADADPI